jgi:hypothetical protein
MMILEGRWWGSRARRGGGEAAAAATVRRVSDSFALARRLAGAARRQGSSAAHPQHRAASSRPAAKSGARRPTPLRAWQPSASSTTPSRREVSPLPHRTQQQREHAAMKSGAHYAPLNWHLLLSGGLPLWRTRDHTRTRVGTAVDAPHSAYLSRLSLARCCCACNAVHVVQALTRLVSLAAATCLRQVLARRRVNVMPSHCFRVPGRRGWAVGGATGSEPTVSRASPLPRSPSALVMGLGHRSRGTAVPPPSSVRG